MMGNNLDNKIVNNKLFQFWSIAHVVRMFKNMTTSKTHRLSKFDFV